MKRKLREYPELPVSLVEAAFLDERALVGGCLIFPEQFLRVRDLVAASDFHNNECAEMWAVISELDAECEQWDLAAIQAGLYRHGFHSPHEIIDRLTEGIVGTDLVRAAYRVRKWSLRWRVIAQLQSVCAQLRHPNADPLECARSTKDKIARVLEGHDQACALTPFSFDSAAALEFGASVLENLKSFLLRFVRLTDAQACAIALWIVHTHAVGAA